MNAEGGERMEVHVCWRWKLVTFHSCMESWPCFYM